MTSWLDFTQLALVAFGGVWALYLYRRSRAAQAKVGIETTVRLASAGSGEERLLILRVRFTNSSGVLLRCDEAGATVFDASDRAADGRIVLTPFAREDLLLPVYGAISDDPGGLAAGRTFEYEENEEVSLEPGEYVDSEVAFVLTGRRARLLALRVAIRGLQGRWGRRVWWWGSFEFVDTGIVAEGPENSRVALRMEPES